MIESSQWDGIIAAYVQFESEEERIFTRLFVFSDELVEGITDYQLKTWMKEFIMNNIKQVKNVLHISLLDNGLIFRNENKYIVNRSEIKVVS